MLGSLPLGSAPLGSGSAAGAGGEATVYGVVAGLLPVLDSALSGHVVVVGHLDGTLPKLTGAATLRESATLVADLPQLTGALTGVQGVIGSIAGSLPTLTGAASGGVYALAASLPALGGTLTGLVGVRGTIAATLPVMTGSAQLNNIGGVTQASLPAITGALTGSVGQIGVVAATLPRVSSVLTGYTSTVGALAASLPRVRGTMSGYGPLVAALGVRLPRLDAAFTVTQDIPGVTTTELPTHVMNTFTAAVTTFSNYGFNSFAEVNGVYLAAGPNGLMKLDSGDLDVTEQIPATFATGLHSFGSAQQKRLSDYYFSGRLAGNMTLTVSTDEQGGYNYTLDPHLVGRLKQRRSAIGKGMRGKYWNFKFTNINGSDFEFDSMGIAAVPTARRI